MAEGSEKEEQEHSTKCFKSTATISFGGSKGLSLSSTESLTLEEGHFGMEEEDETTLTALMVSTKKDPETSHHDNLNKLGRERSKTPPASMRSKGIEDLFVGDSNASLNKTGEKSRDSGVHLDCPPSSNTSSSGGQGESSTSRHSKSSSLPHGVKLCPEGGEGKEGAQAERLAVMEEELRKAQAEIKAKDAEVEILKGIRQQVEGELEDLTASLFQEAHKMVTAAKMKEVSSEKSLKEARMQLEGLQAEVAALKALLITSTPSRPNLGNNGISLFKKQHKRTPSHNHLQYGRAEDEESAAEKGKPPSEVVIDRSRCDVDPILLTLFAAWRMDPTLLRDKSEFLERIYTEDIDPCLSFTNDDLVKKLRDAIEDNSVWVEPLPEKDRNNVPKTCALLKYPRVCNYRMRFSFDSEEWFDISQLCRDRIASVCEFLNYLRYTKNGLVKASVDDAYWEMLRLRKQMTIAKLGIQIS